MKDKSNKLTAYDAGEGIVFALFLMALSLTENGPSVFAVDNNDQALNPRIVRQMIFNVHNWFGGLAQGKLFHS